MQIGVNLPPRQGYERSTSGVRRSKVKVTGGQRYIWKPDIDVILDPLSRVERHAMSDGNVALEKGAKVLHTVLAAPPHLWDMRLADALVKTIMAPLCREKHSLLLVLFVQNVAVVDRPYQRPQR